MRVYTADKHLLDLAMMENIFKFGIKNALYRHLVRTASSFSGRSSLTIERSSSDAFMPCPPEITKQPTLFFGHATRLRRVCDHRTSTARVVDQLRAIGH
ncbi:hypothetical protein IE985_10320 [Klebsiella pneumoniae]|nr:hypothetical protein [Klebsiella pneumoniae]